MIEVRLYGYLRRYAPQQELTGDSLVLVTRRRGDTVQRILARLGISPAEVGLVVVNGSFVPLDNLRQPVRDGGRVALFPADHAALFTCGIVRP